MSNPKGYSDSVWLAWLDACERDLLDPLPPVDDDNLLILD